MAATSAVTSTTTSTSTSTPAHAPTTDSLGDRMKAYEGVTEICLDSTKPFVMRLDGHTFSTFTGGFTKPYDKRISYAMIMATADLITKLHAVTGYTQSDEITLIFPALNPPGTPATEMKDLMFSGRVGKISTLAASYCSIRFNFHLNKCKFDEEDPQDKPLISKVRDFQAHFDGRTFNVDSENECLNNILWRCRDAKRNSKSAFGRKFFSTKQLQNLTSDEVVAKVAREKGNSWEDEPGFFKWGIWVKRALTSKEAVDHKTGAPVSAIRTATRFGSWDVSYSDESVRIVMSKYCNIGEDPNQIHPAFTDVWDPAPPNPPVYPASHP
ncbi:tRNAHis guanylyltransferase [Pelomyxa schiedti]|nr:tRNAHis guanylyltransferase [Pelomyxa schiedti]